jgi:hypothetical protein
MKIKDLRLIVGPFLFIREVFVISYRILKPLHIILLFITSFTSYKMK